MKAFSKNDSADRNRAAFLFSIMGLKKMPLMMRKLLAESFRYLGKIQAVLFDAAFLCSDYRKRAISTGTVDYV